MNETDTVETRAAVGGSRLKRFVMRFVPVARIAWAPDALYITGPDGTRNYLWLHFGPMVSKDGLKAWQFCAGRLSVSIGWPYYA